VQGEGAAEEIERGVHLAQRIKPSLDILVVGRGGGSMEDLWCFNEERVVRAIADCSIPTVSAVGHEIDVTLSDLAADVRALTPSEAAERILPDASELMSRLVESHHRLNRSVLRQVQEAKQHLRLLAERPILKEPMEQIQLRRQRLDDLQDRMERHWSMRLERARSPIDRLAGQLAGIYALNPLIIIELTGNLHPEAIMILFLVLASILALSNRIALAAIPFGFAVSTKFIPVLFIPFLKIYLNFVIYH
jgi:exodeoxyribonuclease VII large subunit